MGTGKEARKGTGLEIGKDKGMRMGWKRMGAGMGWNRWDRRRGREGDGNGCPQLPTAAGASRHRCPWLLPSPDGDTQLRIASVAAQSCPRITASPTALPAPHRRTAGSGHGRVSPHGTPRPTPTPSRRRPRGAGSARPAAPGRGGPARGSPSCHAPPPRSAAAPAPQPRVWGGPERGDLDGFQRMPSLRLIHGATARESRPPPGATPDGGRARLGRMAAMPEHLHHHRSIMRNPTAKASLHPACRHLRLPQYPQYPQYIQYSQYHQYSRYHQYSQCTPRPPPSRPTHGSQQQRLPCPIPAPGAQPG